MIMIEGGDNYLSVEDNANAEIAQSYKLFQNYPNPFNPSTNISYQLPESVFVTLKVYDVLGKEVKILVNERQNAGNHSVRFNASDLPNGVYFYKIEAGTYRSTKKFLLVK